MIRAGSGEPLLLLHGVTGAEGIWEEVLPLVAPHHDTIALTALGHSGGRPPAARPVRIEHLVDDVERSLDELDLPTVHVAGNSMGGWMALELARRGRARSVCALSPAGAWKEDVRDRPSAHHLRAERRDARRFRRLTPLVLRFRRLRRFALRLHAVHGDHISAESALARARESLACEVLDDILDTPEALAPLDPPPCPITIAWSEKDRVLPLDTNGAKVREVVPGARFIVLEGVGHVAMFDDPGLVARTILGTTGATQQAL